MISGKGILEGFPPDRGSDAIFLEAGSSTPEGLRNSVDRCSCFCFCFCFGSSVVGLSPTSPTFLSSITLFVGRRSVPTPFRELKIASRALCPATGFLRSNVSKPLRSLPNADDIDLGFAWTLNFRPLVRNSSCSEYCAEKDDVAPSFRPVAGSLSLAEPSPSALSTA